MGVRAGEGRGPVVHLNGHFDVVPAGQGWTEDPFGGAIKGSRLYGRGTGDMKAGLASAIVRGGGHPPRGRAPAGRGRGQRHRGRGERRIRGRRLPGRAEAHREGPHRLRDHPGAAQPRPHLRRASRRLLVRGHDRRPHRPRQHAVPRRQRDRAHGACAGGGAVRAQARAGRAHHGDAGGSAGRAPRDHQRQHRRGRTVAPGRADAVRGRPLPRRLRSALPARGRLRSRAGGGGGAARAHGRAHARPALPAQGPHGRPSRRAPRRTRR